MSEGALYSVIKFNKDSNRKTAATQQEDVTYSEVKTADPTSPQTVSHCEPAVHINTAVLTREKSGPTSNTYRLAAVCLGLLCALLLTSIIALCVYHTSQSQECSTMERHLKELRANYSNMTEVNKQLQGYYNNVLQKFHYAEKYCPYSPQKRECKPCPQGWEQFNSKCYYFSTEGWHGWEQSRSDCQWYGADLVIVNSIEEQEFISKHTKGHHYWIGLSDSETEGTWLWVDRTPLQKEFWRSGEPDDQGEGWQGGTSRNADCAATDQNDWADLLCSSYQWYICETDALLMSNELSVSTST
ncbi:hypothetical protein MATL_G00050820 [Megalops atlanticus]|uniref:C-type lectin domain-containing protein n=1 Tax=Megalops atlanticus TaxID=7932 RepID=A0A9D3QG24_MEGAT|nr:hypothetical protein MATL_G00050820 [Megalops atlanticus]